VVVKSEDGVATLSRKRAIGSPRDGGRVSINGDMRAASIGSALSDETDATVAVTLPERWSRSLTWWKKRKGDGDKVLPITMVVV